MKKKGFTLIELLGVLVILAITALVAIPVVIKILHNSRLSACEESKRNMELEAKKYLVYQNIHVPENETVTVTLQQLIDEGLITDFSGSCKIEDLYVEFTNINGEIVTNTNCDCEECLGGTPKIKPYDPYKDDKTLVRCQNGLVPLRLEYPEGAYSIKWRVGRSGESQDDLSLTWEDYPENGICVNKADLTNVWVKYAIAGDTVIEPPDGQILVDIDYVPKIRGVKEVTVSITYDSDAVEKKYKVGNSSWLDYEGPFKVTENVIVQAKVAKNIDIMDVNGTYLGTTKITNYDKLAIDNIGRVATAQEISPSIYILDPVYETEVARIEIDYPFNVDDESRKYKINSGEEMTYEEEFPVNICGVEVEAYYYYNGSKSKSASVNIPCDGAIYDMEIVMQPDPMLNEDITESYIRVYADEELDDIKYTLYLQQRDGYYSNGEKKYKEIVLGPYNYDGKIFVHQSGKIVVTGKDTETGITINKEKTFKIKEVVELINPYFSSLAINDETAEVVSLIYTDEDVSSIRYSVNGGGMQNYTGPVTLNRNGQVIYAEVSYKNGATYSASYATSKIRGFRNPNIRLYSNYSSEKVGIVIDYDSYYTQSIKYSVNGGELLDYNDNVIMLYNNGDVVYVENIDSEGKRHDATYAVSGIIPQKDIITYSSTLNESTVERVCASIDDRSVISTQYQIEDGEWNELEMRGRNGCVDLRDNNVRVNFKIGYEGGSERTNFIISSQIRGLNAPTVNEYEVTNDMSDIYSLIEIVPDRYLATSTQYSINGGALQNYVGQFKVHSNGDVVRAISTDKNGISRETIYTAKKVSYANDPTFTSTSKNDSLIENVAINFDLRTLISKKYSIDGGPLQNYTESIDINKNGVVIYAEATYPNNLVKTATYTTSKIRGLRQPRFTTTKSAKELMTEVEIVYDSAFASINEYSIDGGEFIAYETPLRIYKNGTVIVARSIDSDGNEEYATMTVTIDGLKDITFNASLSGDYLAYEVTTIYDIRELKTIKYSINGGELQDLSGKVTLYYPGDVLYVEAEYKDGTIKTGTYTASTSNEYLPTFDITFDSRYANENTITTFYIYIDGRRRTSTTVLLDNQNVSDRCDWEPVKGANNKKTGSTLYCNFGNIATNGTKIDVSVHYENGENKTNSYTESGLRDIYAPSFVGTPDGLGEKVCITFDRYLGTNYKYSIDGGSLISTNDYSICTKQYANNTVIYAENANKFDTNVSVNSSYTTTKATSAPELTIQHSLSADTHSMNVGVVASDTDREYLRYSIDGGQMIDYVKPINIKQNGKVVYFEARYKNGEVKTATYSTTGIIQQLKINIGVEPKTSNLVEKVTVTIDYDSKATEKKYTINNGEEITYTGPFELTKSGTVKAIARGNSAYGEATRMISNILSDELASPVITMTKKPGTTGEIGVISIDYDSKATVKQYSINGGAFRNYTEPFEVEENEATIYAVCHDADYNNAQAQYTVTGLVQYAIIDMGGYSIIKLNYPEAAINKKYKVGAASNWKDYNSDIGFIVIDPAHASEYINSGVVKVEDAKGNLIDYTNNYYVLSSGIDTFLEDVYMKWDIDNKRLPIRIIGTPDNSVTTDTTFVIVLPPAGYKAVEYKINDYDYQTYEAALRIVTNNTTVTARVIYEDDTYSSPVSYTVTNIVRDENDPESTNSEAIYTAADLNAIRYNLNGKYTLMNDIDMSASDYALELPTLGCFSGTLNGNGFKIKNLAVSSSGLFTCLEAGATVKNLTIDRMMINTRDGNKVGAIAGYINGANVTLENIKIMGRTTIRGGDYVGGIIGYSTYPAVFNAISLTSSVNVTASRSNGGGILGYSNTSTTITNSGSRAKVTGSGRNNMGGLIGYTEIASIENSYAAGNVAGAANIGGLIGRVNGSGAILNSYAAGNVTATGDYVGGMVGYNNNTSITNSYATGNVTGSSYIGGLVGQQIVSTINKAYASGNVTGTSSYIGGLIGSSDRAVITNAYSLGNVSGYSYYAGLIGYAYYNNTLKYAYSIGKITPYNNGEQLIHYDSSTTKDGLYYIADTSGRYSSIHGTKIDTIYEGTLASSYPKFDFDEIWQTEENVTTPYIQGLMIDGKNYIENAKTIYRDGSGVSDDPYLIYTPEDLYNIRYSLYGDFKIMNDIDMTTSDYATSFATITDFHGTIDGNGYSIIGLKLGSNGLFSSAVGTTIKNLTLISPSIIGSNDNTGLLIGNASGTTTISNIRVIGTVNITGKTNTGGLVGYSSGNISFDQIVLPSTMTITGTNSEFTGGIIGKSDAKTTITNSSSKVVVNGTGRQYKGGLIGYTNTVEINNSYASGNITGSANIGGLIGKVNSSGSITNSYASGNVTATSDYVGGMVGYNNNTSITNCYASGDVTGSSYIGGLVGQQIVSTINKAYASGNVTGTSSYIGGLIGSSDRAVITNVYSLGNVSGYSYYAGLIGYAYYNNTLKYGYSIGKVTPYNNGEQLIHYDSSTTKEGLYYIADTSGRYSSIHGTKIDTIYEGTLASSYPKFDFTNVWQTETDNTTPYIQGLMIDDKNYVENAKTIYRDGSGVSDDPYLIYTPEDLNNIRYSLYGDFKIMNDLDMTTSEYANNFNTITDFHGTLDGNGHSITGLKINSNGLFASTVGVTIKNLTLVTPTIKATSNNNVGFLIGSATGDTTISNIKLVGNINLQGNQNVGGLVGYSANNISFDKVVLPSTMTITGTNSEFTGGIIGKSDAKTTITNSSSKVAVNGTGRQYKGGLIGYTNTVEINNSYASGNITGSANIGGLIGKVNSSGSITNSYASGNVTGTSDYVGGMVGYNNNTSITNCYATGDVRGSSYIGGLVGQQIVSTINKAYASGNVTGTSSYIGGLIGSSDRAVITNVYSLGNVSGYSYYAGLIGYAYYNNTLKYAYSLGKVLPYNNGEQLIHYDSSTTKEGLYYIADTSGRYSSIHGTKIDTIYEGTLASSYPKFDFTNVWQTETNNATPYIQGLMIDSKNYIENSITIEREGKGTSDDPYLIYTPEDLYNIRNSLYADFKIMNDIDMTNSEYATSFATISDFHGTLDGNNYSIIGLKTSSNGLFSSTVGATIKNIILTNPGIVATDRENTGLLIGSASGNTTISNIKVVGNVNITGRTNTGGLVGYSANNITFDKIVLPSTMTITGTYSEFTGGIIGKSDAKTTITNSSSKVVVNGTGRQYKGGLIGYTNTVEINNSYASGNITGSANIGGLIGKVNSSGSITNSYASGNVTATSDYVGGMVGYNNNTSITNCYASGDVRGSSYIGGLVGQQIVSTINKAYASGNVTGTSSYIGGLIGSSDRAVITNVYSLGNVSGYSYYAGLIGYAYYNNTLKYGYSIGKVTPYNNGEQLIHYDSSTTKEGLYYIADTSERYSSIHGTKIDTIYEGTVASSYPAFDFTNIWQIEDNTATPYIQGLMIDSKNYIVNSITVPREGKGIPEDPYIIYTPDDLNNIRHSLYADYKLANDIDLTNSSYATSFATISDFHGTLNGDGHSIIGLKVSANGLFSSAVGVTIKNLTLVNPVVNATDRDNTGLLIGYASGNTTINNINVTGTSTLTGRAYIGGLVGYSKDNITFENISLPSTMTTTITNAYGGGLIGKCDARVTINNSTSIAIVDSDRKNYIGGLIGQTKTVTINNSHAAGNVRGASYIGGLIGQVTDSGSITNSYTTGSVTGTGDYIGGMIGYDSNVSITNSYATGNVSGSSYIGGLVGHHIIGTINKVYTTGNVTGTSSYIGGLIGSSDRATITNFYTTGNVSGYSYYAGIVGYAYYNNTIKYGYTTSSVTPLNNGNQLIHYNSGTNYDGMYFVSEVGSRTTSEFGTDLVTLANARKQASYPKFDFDTVWAINENSSLPYFKNN